MTFFGIRLSKFLTEIATRKPSLYCVVVVVAVLKTGTAKFIVGQQHRQQQHLTLTYSLQVIWYSFPAHLTVIGHHKPQYIQQHTTNFNQHVNFVLPRIWGGGEWRLSNCVKLLLANCFDRVTPMISIFLFAFVHLNFSTGWRLLKLSCYIRVYKSVFFFLFLHRNFRVKKSDSYRSFFLP